MNPTLSAFLGAITGGFATFLGAAYTARSAWRRDHGARLYEVKSGVYLAALRHVDEVIDKAADDEVDINDLLLDPVAQPEWLRIFLLHASPGVSRKYREFVADAIDGTWRGNCFDERRLRRLGRASDALRYAIQADLQLQGRSALWRERWSQRRFHAKEQRLLRNEEPGSAS